MINSVTKPTTQETAAINNFEEWDIDLLLTYDTYLFNNFNRYDWLLKAYHDQRRGAI